MLALCLTLAMVLPEAAEPLRDGGGSGPATLPPDGAEPLGSAIDDAAEPAPKIARPLGNGPRRERRRPELLPKSTPIVRVDLLFGPLWRLRTLDTLLQTSVEYGRVQGFSGSFHTGILIAPDRDSVRALDFPLGVGAVARGRLAKRPGYASVGLTAGLLVHRAATERGVIRRVDPDFRLPIRFAWTLATVGLSLALEQGYSVRHRSYERRGVEVWARHAYRVGFVLGLHSDFVPGAKRRRRSGI